MPRLNYWLMSVKRRFNDKMCIFFIIKGFSLWSEDTTSHLSHFWQQGLMSGSATSDKLAESWRHSRREAVMEELIYHQQHLKCKPLLCFTSVCKPDNCFPCGTFLSHLTARCDTVTVTVAPCVPRLSLQRWTDACWESCIGLCRK